MKMTTIQINVKQFQRKAQKNKHSYFCCKPNPVPDNKM